MNKIKEVLVIDLVDDNDDFFVIDTKQCDESSKQSALISSNESNTFDSNNIISHVISSPIEKKSRKSGQCFNCMGDHSLNDCSEPRNNRRISLNRNKFRGSKQYNNARLHEQSDKMLYTPGKISDELRAALNIGFYDIPEWIFRMRRKGLIHGYPPSYLKKSMEKSVFSFVTRETANEELDDIIDPHKLYIYPGFNYYDRRLNDIEKFEIPPWENFVKMHQKALNDKNILKRKASIEENEKSKRVKKFNEAIEDGEIYDDGSFNDTTITIESESDLNQDDSKRTNDSLIINNEVTVTKGTPILMKKSISVDRYNHEVIKPDLEKFSKDIVPFQHSNITEERGFFTKLLDAVKNLRNN